MLDYRDMDVLWVRTQIFLIILLTVQRWVHRHMDVFYVRTQVFLRRVQQCERLLALVVLVSGFTHNE